MQVYCISDDGTLLIPVGAKRITAKELSDVEMAQIKHLIFPDTITSIGRKAFAGLPNLETVSFGCGSKVTTIPADCFRDCRSLMSVQLPSGVETIGADAFRGCQALVDVSLGDHLVTIGERAFALCSSLVTVDIPETVLHIRFQAFACCTMLAHIHLPSHLVLLSAFAFDSCCNITNIKMPDTVSSIGMAPFDPATAVSVSNVNPRFRAVDGSLVSTDGTFLFHLHTDQGVCTVPDGVRRLYNDAIIAGSAAVLRIPATFAESNHTGLGFRLSGLQLERIYADCPQGVLDASLNSCCSGKYRQYLSPRVALIADSWDFSTCHKATQELLLRGYCVRLENGERIPADVDTTLRQAVRQRQRSCWDDIVCRPGMLAGGLMSLDFCCKLVEQAADDGSTDLLGKLLSYRSQWFSREAIAAADRQRALASVR